ncbi:hypothetical protein CJF42_06300 [Pseudoalteromonas sp. NBT06-2]|uniref:hypothetical protein n=1 Tax=Pseudoalteromonas sp. NBT06-2 TaxID=2025950 RepID=UPI000BC681F5|nr:hypothetical protein [Pseudoalteromonas sp. NBT06-2]PAJ75257.1 hypothetical protein CJF42_06300 [Pseudoalteromonas sp. NBT06-2]
MNIKILKNTWLKLSFVWLLLIKSSLVLAHSDDFTRVEVKLQIPALDNKLTAQNGDLINLTQAYLSSFSFELIACPQINLKPVNNDKVNLLSWLIPAAHANHGVSFTKPTQIPVQQRHNLLVKTDIYLGIYKLPKGKYCQMNYTLGKVPDNQGLSSEITKSSLFIAGKQFELNIGTSHIIAKSDYAFGKNFPINLEIPASHKPLSLVISINVSEALKIITHSVPSHKNGRLVLLSLSEQVTLELML